MPSSLRERCIPGFSWLPGSSAGINLFDLEVRKHFAVLFADQAIQAEPDMHGHMQAPAAHQRPAAGVLPDWPCSCCSSALVMLARVPASHPWAATDWKRFLQWTCLPEADLLVQEAWDGRRGLQAGAHAR